MRSLFWGRGLALALGICILAAAAYGQDAAILRQNTFEAGPFGGISYGVDHVRGMGGANVTYSILPNILLYGEYSYFPSIEHSILVPSTQAKYTVKIPLQDINFGVHVRFRIPKTPLVPYAVAGVGLLHSPSTMDTVSLFNAATGQYEAPNHYSVSSSTSFAFDYGAGVRWYIRESFGLRGEFKGYVLTGGPLHDSASLGLSGGLGASQLYRATLGFFFQF